LGYGDEGGRDTFGPHLDGGEEVVAIHDSMDGIVHGHKVETSGRSVGVRVPAEEQDGDVVVPVEEDEFLLLSEEKEEGRRR